MSINNDKIKLNKYKYALYGTTDLYFKDGNEYNLTNNNIIVLIKEKLPYYYYIDENECDKFLNDLPYIICK